MVAHQALEVVVGEERRGGVQVVGALRRAVACPDVGRRADQDQPAHQSRVPIGEPDQEIAAARDADAGDGADPGLLDHGAHVQGVLGEAIGTLQRVR